MENTNPWGNTSIEYLYPVQAGLKVMRGYDAQPGEFPHQVYLSHKKNGQEHMCSASIIHPLFLLTAAHCVFNMTPATIDLVTGEYDLSWIDGTEQRPHVNSITVHEKYDARTYANDIAILTLQSPLKLDNFTNVIKIPKPDQILPSWAFVSGWGSTGNGWTSDVLQKAKLAIVNTQRCRSFLKGLTVTDGMICAGTGDKDVCAGDSGGPLTCEDATARGQKYLCGIVSWGYSCEHQNEYKYRLPGVYTDVRKYHAWIENHTTAQIPTAMLRDEGSKRRRSQDCKAGEFRCKKNGICVPNKLWCKAKIDCPIADDSNKSKSMRATCPFSKFVCNLLRPTLRQQLRYVNIFCNDTTPSEAQVRTPTMGWMAGVLITA